MATHFSGSLLASLHYEQTHGTGDQEGFLLGKVVNRLTDVISDSQLQHTKEENTLYVFNYIPCHGLYSWYDSGGNIIMDSLHKLLQGDQHHKEVIGWYKMRRQSSLSVSLRERMVHRNLLKTFPGVSQKHFLYALFTTSAVSNMATHSFDHAVHYLDGKQFRRLPILVVNLEDTAHCSYRRYPCNNATGLFSRTVERQGSDFLEANEQLKEVVSMRTLQSQVQMKLTELSMKLTHSEESLGTLRNEVARLREIHWKKHPLKPLDVSDMEKQQSQSGQPANQRHAVPFPLPSFASEPSTKVPTSHAIPFRLPASASQPTSNVPTSHASPFSLPTSISQSATNVPTSKLQPQGPKKRRSTLELHDDLLLLAKDAGRTAQSMNNYDQGGVSDEDIDIYSSPQAAHSGAAAQYQMEAAIGQGRITPNCETTSSRKSMSLATGSKAPPQKNKDTTGTSKTMTLPLASTARPQKPGDTAGISKPKSFAPVSADIPQKSEGASTVIGSSLPPHIHNGSSNDSTAEKKPRDHFDFVSDMLTKAQSPTSPLPLHMRLINRAEQTQHRAETKKRSETSTITRTKASHSRGIQGDKDSALYAETTQAPRVTRQKISKSKQIADEKTIDVELSSSPTF